MESKPRIIVVGGGFAGVRAMLDLVGQLGDRAELILVSQNKMFEYYPGLHQIVGHQHEGLVELPLSVIFEPYRVTLVHERVIGCDPAVKAVTLASGTILQSDYLVMALGSQTDYFNIKGLNELSFGLKSVAQARALKAHIEHQFKISAKTEGTERVIGLHFVVVGGGPAGVDLAGELAHRTKQLARQYEIPESFVTLDLIEAAPRILPMMNPAISASVESRLRSVGVNIFLNRNLMHEGSWTLFFQDMTLGAKTVIWTAGITTHEFYKSISGFTLGRKNRVLVDEYLQPKGFENVFVVGDAADTPYAGLAQTALYDGAYVASVIAARASDSRSTKTYKPKSVAYNIGVGHKWSVFVLGPIVIKGIIAFWLRTLIDLRFFMSILPIRRAWNSYLNPGRVSAHPSGEGQT